MAAVRTVIAPKIDGQLNEESWKQAPVFTEFVQNYPVFRGQLTNRTEVRLLYDDNAVYVSAFMQDDPALVRKQLTARDGEQQQDVVDRRPGEDPDHGGARGGQHPVQAGQGRRRHAAQAPTR